MGKNDSAGTWPEDGLIFCEREQTWCCRVDMDSGRCMIGLCDIRDPDYIARKAEAEHRRKRNEERERMKRKERRL